MAGLIFNDINASVNQGYDRGQQLQANRLLGSAIANPDNSADAIGQAAAIDPRSALAVKGAIDSDQDRQAKKLAGAANYVLQAYQSGNPKQVEGAYQAVRPFLNDLGKKLGQGEASPNFTEEMLPHLYQIVGQAGGDTGLNGQLPTGFREADLQAKAAGYQPGTPEYKQVMRIATGVEGRASSAGIGFQKVTGADGRERVVRNNPRTGAVEVYDETTGQFTPAGVPAQTTTGAPNPGQPSQPTAIGGFEDMPVSTPSPQVSAATPSDMSPVNDANRWLKAGIHEREVGARLSLKYGDKLGSGQYPSVAIKDGVAVVATPEGRYAPAQANPSLMVSRTPEETAGAVQNAKNASDIAYLPQQKAIEANAAVDAAGRTVTSKGNAERALDRPQATAAMQDATSNLDRLSQAANDLIHHPGLNGITSWNARVPDAPGSDAANARALLVNLKSQIGFGVLQAMRNASKTGGALGSVSDSEGVRLENNLASLEQSQSPEAFKANLRKVMDYVNQTKSRLGNAYNQTYQGSAGGQSPLAAHAPQTQAEYDALPSGAVYTDPDDGKTYRKP